MKKYDYFSHVFDKAHHDQLLTRYLPFAPLCRVDEWMTKSSLSSLQDLLSKFCQIMAAKTLKNLLAGNDVQNFLEWEGDQNTERKTKVTFSVALIMAFLAAGYLDPCASQSTKHIKC